MMRPFVTRLGSGAALVAAAAAIGAPTSAPAATVGSTGGAGSAVRALGDTIVFSQWDRTAQRWYLNVRTVGGKPRRVAIAPSRMPFDADIGTDGKGRPELIYQRCEVTQPNPPALTGQRIHCDLYAYSLTAGTGERAVRNANDGGRNDVGGTLWQGRVAWIREYGTQAEPNPVVYTKLLTAPRSQPSTRLPGVPTRRCATDVGLIEPPCGPTRFRSVQALELRGDGLALIVRYVFDGLGGISQTEMRLDSVARRSARQIALLVSGLDGQFLVGPSLSDSRLSWYRSCGVTEASCRTFAGPWRYGLSTGTYTRGTPGPTQVRGFADAGSRLYEVPCSVAAQDVGARPLPADCPVTSTAPPAYTAVPPPDLAPSQPPR